MRETLAARHDAVRAAIGAAGLDALVVTHLPNVFFLTGFTGSAAILVVTATGAPLLTDFRYDTVVRDLLEGEGGWPGGALVRVGGAYDEGLATLLEGLETPRVGVEAAHLSLGRHRWLVARLPGRPELVPTHGIVERVRVRKDAREIATLRAAGRLLSAVARDLLRLVQPGPSELEFAALVDYKLKSAGFSRPAFETIVAAGSNAALPHARPGPRRLQSGDLVVLDFGGVYDGYCVDLTRTVCLGRPDERMRSVYDAVAEAQRAALAAVKPGVAAGSVDAAARAVLARHDLAEAFGHGTGHGLGIEVHEAPRVAPPQSGPGAPESPELLETGMVFTIEPGAYVRGWGGVRLEDDVLVTADGCEMLTHVPQTLAAGDRP